jgi:hypothetical protein
VTYVDAIPTAGGSYDNLTGIWAQPDLGTTPADNSAALRLQALVKQNLINSTGDVVAAINKAEIITPQSSPPVQAEVETNIVCSFCIDWEIVSVNLDNADRFSVQDGLELQFFLDVEVANNGPVFSDATVSVLQFDITAYGPITLVPVSPVPVSLAPGQTQSIRYSTPWLGAPSSTYTISWDVEVSDLSLPDPVLPNNASGSWTGTVTDGGGGCFIATAAYGSWLDPHVRSLRHFRDSILLHSRFGRALVSAYYRYSPPIAARIEHSTVLRAIVRLILAPVVFAIEKPAVALAGFLGLLVLISVIGKQARREHS